VALMMSVLTGSSSTTRHSAGISGLICLAGRSKDISVLDETTLALG
jgi:hypothetical protein